MIKYNNMRCTPQRTRTAAPMPDVDVGLPPEPPDDAPECTAFLGDSAEVCDTPLVEGEVWYCPSCGWSEPDGDWEVFP
jgi:hypothetical protein